MWNGYSSYQFVYGKNPNLPNVLVDEPPCLSNSTFSETFAKHINALHEARKSFLETENSERIRRALCHKIRTSCENFEHGDKVYYKRENSNKWHGPGTVICKDGKIIFVRHGGVFVRVSTNRLLKNKYYLTWTKLLLISRRLQS